MRKIVCNTAGGRMESIKKKRRGKVMRKHLAKRILGAGLALALAAGLCACGKKENDRGENANAALAKESVYKIKPVALSGLGELNDSEKNWFQVQGIASGESGIHMVLNIRNRYENTESYCILAVEGDGSGVQAYALTDPEEVQGSPDYGHFAVAADGTVFAVCAHIWTGGDVVWSGTAGEGGITDENVVADSDTTTGEKAADSGDATAGEKAADSGDVTVGENVADRDAEVGDTASGESTGEERSLVCCWNGDGTLRWKSELTEPGDREKAGETCYVAESWVAADGSFHLLFSGDNAYGLCVEPEGKVQEMVKLSEQTAGVLANCLEVLPAADGSLRIVYSDEDDWTMGWLAEYDPGTDSFGEPGAMPSELIWNGYDTMLAGLGSDLVYADVNGVYRYDKGEAQGRPMMNYINSDRNITTLYAMAELDEEHFFALYCEDFRDELQAGIFEHVDPEDIEDRDVLVLAGILIDDEMRARVVDYNRANDECRIVLKEYGERSFGDGLLTLNTEIAAGDMPDILVASGLPVDDYIRQGLIADIWPLIKGDEELSETEFMTNVFDAYSRDGKLYYVVPSFTVVTMAAKTSLVGDGSGWSMEKMKQVLEGMGGNVLPVGDPLTRSDFINKALVFCGGAFIDAEAGSCAFDTEEFITLIEFANTLPEEIDRAALAQSGFFRNIETQFLDNRALLMELWINSLSQDLSYRLNGYLGGEFSLVGFPAAFGEGAYITSENQLVLFAGSENLEGAWEFARYYLTDEYQEKTQYGLPVNRRILMEQAKQTMERPCYIDENGEKVEYDYTLSFNGEEVTVPPLSQEQLDQVLAHIEAVRTVGYDNQDVMNIINEELGSFFAGQKSAKEAAALIQNRVQLYVEANR